MLTNTFCHLPGVGLKTEQTLWEAGFLSWQCALTANGSCRRLRQAWLPLLREAVTQHANQEPAYFSARMPVSQHWRLFRDFRSSCAFVDIETTGLSPYAHEITTIVLYDGKTVRHYVNGQNLDDFPRDLQAYRLLVTYNGKCFDAPFIESYFGIKLAQAHLDLRHVLRGLGLAGGQKQCERLMGIRRAESTDVDGFLAVLLWRQYRRTRDRRYLETLLAYNVEDAVNLEALMVRAYNRNVQLTPFADQALTLPVPPQPLFHVDRSALATVSREHWSGSMASRYRH